MKVLIVEDENVAAQQLKQLIRSCDPSIQISQVISSCKKLKKWFRQNEDTDLIFCDIELSDGNVLNTLGDVNLNSAIIFTTAYDNFWSQAMKLNGIEYLLKPLTEEKVHAALAKTESIKRVFNKDKGILSKLSSLLIQQQPKFYKKRFPIRLNNEVFVLEAESILFFRIGDGVIFAHLEGDKKYPLVEETLTDLEVKLNPEIFFRINRSEIISAHYIDSIRIREGNDYIIQVKGSEQKLSVSSSRVTALKEWLDDPLINVRDKL